MPAWLVLTYLFTIGSVPTQSEGIEILKNSNKYTYALPLEGQNTSVTFGLGTELFNIFRIQSEMKSYQTFQEIKNVLPSFMPYRIDYTFKAELFYKNISLGIRHECDHSVISESYPTINKYISSETEIYLKFEGKIAPWMN
jgi:hypothetical protein